MKSSNKFMIIIFLTILFGVLLLYPINFILIKKGIISLDNPQSYEVLKGNSLETKLLNIKNNIENKTVNYFPLYNNINYTLSNIENKSNTTLYNLLDRKFLPIGTNADGEYIYKNIVDNYYILKSEYNSDELDKRIEKQINFYNYLSEKSEVYIYLPNRYEFNYDTELDTKNMADFVDYFKSNINKNIIVDTLETDNYHEYFYKTDHHWNGYGALKGYQEIMNMLGLTPKNYEVKKLDNIKYRGAMVKSAADTSIFENFYYIDANLEYKTNITENLKPRKVEIKSNPFYDYYVAYYYGMYGEVIYDYENPRKENVLILGDSYVWSIDYLIASYFNKTHVINLRFLDSFDYEKYITDNKITKVIVVNETQTTLFDAYNHNMLEKVGR